jgi:type I site-specific restriction endonuclease
MPIETMSIEHHENELKELLTRVMRDPLQPLQTQLEQTGKSVERLDHQLSTLREVELNGVCARLDTVEKVLKRLRSWTEEDAASEIKNAILPPVQGALDTLGVRLDGHTAAITLPVQGISQELAQTTTAMERLAEHSVEARALAVQRDASLGDQVRDLSAQQAEQWRLMQAHVRAVADAAVDTLSTVSVTASAAQQSDLQRLVESEVSQRIDKLIILGRWTVCLAVAAVCAASGALAVLIYSLQR